MWLVWKKRLSFCFAMDWGIKYYNSNCFIRWTGFFTENDLVLLNLSGFLSDLCVFARETFKSFYGNFAVNEYL